MFKYFSSNFRATMETNIEEAMEAGQNVANEEFAHKMVFRTCVRYTIKGVLCLVGIFIPELALPAAIVSAAV